jgi:hypothetical protein
MGVWRKGVLIEPLAPAVAAVLDRVRHLEQCDREPVERLLDVGDGDRNALYRVPAPAVLLYGAGRALEVMSSR